MPSSLQTGSSALRTTAAKPSRFKRRAGTNGTAVHRIAPTKVMGKNGGDTTVEEQAALEAAVLEMSRMALIMVERLDQMHITMREIVNDLRGARGLPPEPIVPGEVVPTGGATHG